MSGVMVGVGEGCVSKGFILICQGWGGVLEEEYIVSGQSGDNRRGCYLLDWPGIEKWVCVTGGVCIKSGGQGGATCWKGRG